MEYKGYVAEVEYDDTTTVLQERVLNTRDVISFEADSASEMRRAFEAAVGDYLEFCAERGEEPDRPYSGKFLIRATVQLHRAAAVAAARERKSLNQWATEVLARAAQG
ncbi:MAG: type II toxin-antitoxin system HicB family antitoxin [Gemmatimonadetes bacterium]|nr:type II toxin-antitoxin system HicB family antitoxin [Gemmatimonadota bacterium]